MRFLSLAALATAAALPAQAATFFPGTPYLSQADIPTGFYAGGSPTFLETFEDGTLDGGITSNPGIFYIGPPEGGVDSVEYNDGTGTSWFVNDFGSTIASFVFATPVTAAALVWTDGARSPYAFEAYAEDGTLLDSILQTVGTPNDPFGTDRDEDRFFGITSAVGIKRIRMVGPELARFEIDHLQYGDRFVENTPPPPDVSVVPLPAGMPLLVGALGLMGVLRRRRR